MRGWKDLRLIKLREAEKARTDASQQSVLFLSPGNINSPGSTRRRLFPSERKYSRWARRWMCARKRQSAVGRSRSVRHPIERGQPGRFSFRIVHATIKNVRRNNCRAKRKRLGRGTRLPRDRSPFDHERIIGISRVHASYPRAAPSLLPPPFLPFPLTLQLQWPGRWLGSDRTCPPLVRWMNFQYASAVRWRGIDFLFRPSAPRWE